MNKLFVHSFKTSLGTIHTAATDKGLALVTLPTEGKKHFERKVADLFPRHSIQVGGAINKKAEGQLKRYLDGKLRTFDLALDIRGTDFQKKTLRRVAKIPHGKTMTYGEIARAVGSPNSARAVGSANARNNLPLVIPCHRVVASGGLGGYGGGLAMKRRLLKMEGAI